ncbi:MAG: hypothetical protein MJK18_07195, partial [Bdellovibrionales bacterium]|nr:hypothetical protein [Bdellovibrionales bacterium]
YGVDNGGRQLPEDVINGEDISQLFQGTTRHRITEDTEGRGAETLPEFSFSLGDGWGGNKFKLGYTFSGLYKDNLNFVDEQRARFREGGGQLVNEERYTRSKATKERVIGGILGVSTQIMKNHKINVNYIGIRNTTDYVAVLEGQNQNENTIRQTEREFAARILKTVLVQGESELKEFNNTKFTTYFSSSRARRDEPSRILDVYSPDDEGNYVFNLNDNTTYQRRYYDLQENVQDLGLTASTAFPWFSGRKGQVSAGFSQLAKTRESTMRRFGFDGNNQQCPFDMSQDLDQIFTNCGDFINPRNVTQPTDNYNATQDLQAYHFTTKWPLLSSVTLNTGMRYEESVQKVTTISPLENSFILSELRTFNWLPGNSLTWKLNKKMQIRLAQSETISRPDLRELSNTVWQDFDLGYDVTGSPNLKATVIKNYDARWEWYFRRKENVSFGFFYKEFDKPIEQYFTNQTDPTIGFTNAQTAEDYGAEIEFS